MAYTPQDTVKDPEVFRELQEIAREMKELPQMRVMYREPQKPRDGLFCICDGTAWNPLGDGIKRPVWFDQDALLWKAF